MELDLSLMRFGNSNKLKMNTVSTFKKTERILLRGPEPCKQCGAFYKSLYIIRLCMDHEELEGI